MKKNLIYISASVLTFSLAFISCANNDYEETLNANMSKSKMTRAVSSVTYDDIQALIDELCVKYNSEWIINVDRKKPIGYYTEQYFLLVENILRKDAGLEPLEKSSTKSIGSYSLWDDSSINEIAVASTTDDKEAGDPLDPINFDGDYTMYNVGFRYDDIANNNDALSAFNRYFFDITYHIKYSSSVGNNQVTFVDFSDETNYNRNNIHEDWLNQSSYSEIEDIPNSVIEDLMNTYKLAYVENSFSYVGNILQNDEETNLNPGAESLLFDYYFDMNIGDVKMRVLITHPSKSIDIWKSSK